MAHIAIARKYRPSNFSEVVGQEKITETLKNAIKLNIFSHAYIFAGPRGVGKTTTARIVAKALNCKNLNEGEPCNLCDNCLEISKGSFPDVVEIDAASNRGIDHIRNLRETVQYSPVKGKKKVYIIDEFHMLTKEAFNALLKTLEEPPNHVVFILATTEIEKIPATIMSRCQRFLFKRVPLPKIAETLKNICIKENIPYDEEALNLIASASEGSLRDAESLLEQSVALGEGKLKTELASKFLGVLGTEQLRNILELSFKGKKESLREMIKELESTGYDAMSILKQLISLTEKEYVRNSSSFSEEELMAAFEILSNGLPLLSRHPFPFTALFFQLMKLSYFKEVKRITEIPISIAEKKTENGFDYSVYIETTFDRGDFIEIIPKNLTAYERLSEHISQVENHFGKPVKLAEPAVKQKNNGKVELDKETEEKINLLLDMFDAKIVPGYPKRKEE